MATVVLMPKLGLTMTEGTIVEWLKREGDKVEKGEPLVCILTEKVSYEYESPSSGILKKILRGVNEVVAVTEPIAVIAGAEENISDLELPRILAPEMKAERPLETKAEAISPQEKRGLASPLAKKIAQEKGVDLARIIGTGPGGRITKDDVLKFTKMGERHEPLVEIPSSEVIQVSPIRQTIGQRMSESKKNIPHYYLSVEVDMTQLVDFRKRILEYVEREKEVRVSLTDLFVKIVAHALKKHPWVNSTFEGRQIRLYKEINIGVAMAGKDGLLVPVVRRADECSVSEISLRTKKLNQKLLDGTLALDDVTGGTFTISNLGMYEIDLFTAIINPPQCAILAMGKVANKPVAADDKVVVKPMMWMTLSVDHRILDGKQAAEFLNEIKVFIGNPHLLIA